MTDASNGGREPMMTPRLGAIQFWLQGHPDRRRPWLVVRLGNWLSDVRWRLWLKTGGWE